MYCRGRSRSLVRSTSPVSLDGLGASTALVIISISGAQFLVSRYFHQDICFTPLQSSPLPKLRLTGLAYRTPAILKCCFVHEIPTPAHDSHPESTAVQSSCLAV